MITYRYDAYGNTTKSNNTLNNPYQYNAEYTDSSTDQQYLRARYYDSSQGRFTTKDTLLGSIRLDVVQFDDAGKIIGVWDLKTGNAKLTPKRKQQIFDALKEGDLVSDDFTIDLIKEIKP